MQFVVSQIQNLQRNQPVKHSVGKRGQVVVGQIQSLQPSQPVKHSGGKRGQDVVGQIQSLQPSQPVKHSGGKRGQVVVGQIQNLQRSQPVKPSVGKRGQVVVGQIQSLQPSQPVKHFVGKRGQVVVVQTQNPQRGQPGEIPRCEGGDVLAVQVERAGDVGKMRVGDKGAVTDAGDLAKDPVAHHRRAPADAGGGDPGHRHRGCVGVGGDAVCAAAPGHGQGEGKFDVRRQRLDRHQGRGARVVVEPYRHPARRSGQRPAIGHIRAPRPGIAAAAVERHRAPAVRNRSVIGQGIRHGREGRPGIVRQLQIRQRGQRLEHVVGQRGQVVEAQIQRRQRGQPGEHPGVQRDQIVAFQIQRRQRGQPGEHPGVQRDQIVAFQTQRRQRGQPGEHPGVQRGQPVACQTQRLQRGQPGEHPGVQRVQPVGAQSQLLQLGQPGEHPGGQRGQPVAAQTQILQRQPGEHPGVQRAQLVAVQIQTRQRGQRLEHVVGQRGQVVGAQIQRRQRGQPGEIPRREGVDALAVQLQLAGDAGKTRVGDKAAVTDAGEPVKDTDAHLSRALADAGSLGLDRPARRIRVAGQLLVAAPIVGEADLHADLLADIRLHRHVGVRGLAGDVGCIRHAVGIHPDPLVAVSRAGETVLVRDVRGHHPERPAHPRLARRAADRRPARGRVVQCRHVHRHDVGRRALIRAVAHPEGEARIAHPVGVRLRGEHQIADLRRRDRLVHRHRRAVERQRARRRQRHHRDARQRIARVGVGEVELVLREGVRRVLVGCYRSIGRRRGVVRGPRHRHRIGLGAGRVLRRHRHNDRVVAHEERGNRDPVGEIAVGNRVPVQGDGADRRAIIGRHCGQPDRRDSVGHLRGVARLR